MFDRRLYHEVCRELRAPEEKIEEILTMTKTNPPKKRHRPVRTILVAAAAVAMMAVGVSAANPQSVQEMLVQIATVVRVDEFRQEMTTTDGEQMTVLSLPKIQVENQEGRAVLVVDEEQTDITDALAQDGSYVYEKATQEGTKLTVTVKGSGAEEWIMEVSMYEDGEEVLSYSAKSGENSLGVGGSIEGMPEDWEVNVGEGEENISAAITVTDSSGCVALDKTVSD